MPFNGQEGDTPFANPQKVVTISGQKYYVTPNTLSDVIKVRIADTEKRYGRPLSPSEMNIISGALTQVANIPNGTTTAGEAKNVSFDMPWLSVLYKTAVGSAKKTAEVFQDVGNTALAIPKSGNKLAEILPWVIGGAVLIYVFNVSRRGGFFK